MQTPKLKTAEEVLDFCLNQLSLGTYDKRFFTNLFISNILPRKAITSNQLTLFKKVVNKYHKQFSKHNLLAFDMADLPWSLQIIQSQPEFTCATVEIKDGQLILRSPYKNTFVQDFRTSRLMTWDGNNKQYHCEFGIKTLQKVLVMVEKHYEERHYSDEILKIFDELKPYESCTNWEPKLYRINGNLMIASTNESLDEALKDIPLNTDLATLALLASYGIKVDKQLALEIHEEMGSTDEDKQELLFALSIQAQCEVTELPKLKKWLHDIKCDHVLFGTMYTTKHGVEEYENIISQFDIPYTIATAGSKSTATRDLVNRKYKMPVLIKFNSFNYRGLGSMFSSKVVELVNSNPIEIK